MFHRAIGCFVLLGWLWTVLHLRQTVPSLVVAGSSKLYVGHGGGVGFYILLLPLLAAALLIFPQFFVDRFNPYTGMDNEPLFGLGSWRLVGYLVLLLSWALLTLFHSLG